MSGLSRALVPAQESRGGRLDGFCFCLSLRRVYFWALKDKKNWRRKYGPPQFKSPAADAVCVSSFKLDILRT